MSLQQIKSWNCTQKDPESLLACGNEPTHLFPIAAPPRRHRWQNNKEQKRGEEFKEKKNGNKK